MVDYPLGHRIDHVTTHIEGRPSYTLITKKDHSMREDKIKSVDFGEKDELKASLEALKRNTEAMIEYACLMAKIRRKAYLAYVGEGFTEEQALELCKNT